MKCQAMTAGQEEQQAKIPHWQLKSLVGLYAPQESHGKPRDG